MHSIIVKPINSQFVVVWVKLQIRRGLSVMDFNFDQVPNNENTVTITNPSLLESLKTDFSNFRQSKLSMEEFFQCNIIIATREKSSSFFIKKGQKLVYNQVNFQNLRIILINMFSLFLFSDNGETLFISKKKVNCRHPNLSKDHQRQLLQFSIYHHWILIIWKNTRKQTRCDSMSLSLYKEGIMESNFVHRNTIQHLDVPITITPKSMLL